MSRRLNASESETGERHWIVIELSKGPRRKKSGVERWLTRFDVCVTFSVLTITIIATCCYSEMQDAYTCTGRFRIIDFHSEFIARVHTHTLTKTESVVLNGISKEKNYIGKKKCSFTIYYCILSDPATDVHNYDFAQALGGKMGKIRSSGCSVLRYTQRQQQQNRLTDVIVIRVFFHDGILA